MSIHPRLSFTPSAPDRPQPAFRPVAPRAPEAEINLHNGPQAAQRLYGPTAAEWADPAFAENHLLETVRELHTLGLINPARGTRRRMDDAARLEHEEIQGVSSIRNYHGTLLADDLLDWCVDLANGEVGLRGHAVLNEYARRRQFLQAHNVMASPYAYRARRIESEQWWAKTCLEAPVPATDTVGLAQGMAQVAGQNRRQLMADARRLGAAVRRWFAAPDEGFEWRPAPTAMQRLTAKVDRALGPWFGLPEGAPSRG